MSNGVETYTGPTSAWTTIFQTIEADLCSTAFDRKLRDEIKKAYDQIMLIASTKLVVPSHVERAHDPLAHLTQDDIWRLVRQELDLYNEGEDNDIKTKACAARVIRFLAKHKPVTS